MSYFSEFAVFDRRRFEIAIVCALEIESTAVEACFDEIYDAALYGKAHGDLNAYTLGRIGQHHVVLTYLPSIGKASSALAAAGLRTSFTKITLSLLVGICGSVPFRQEEGSQVEILLGDVIISTGVVQYDLGRQYDVGRPVRKKAFHDNLGRLPPEVRALLHKCQAGIERARLRHRLQQYVEEICCKEDYAAYARPTTQPDVLYPSEYLHRHRDPHTCSACSLSKNQTCEKARVSTCEELGCESGARIQRIRCYANKAATSDIRIHWGLIASGDSVIKSGRVRDEIARTENVIAFEMEGVGMWEAFATIVVKGVCDYSDSHKNKGWQKYSALTAAAAAKALLVNWTPSASDSGPSVAGSGRASPTLQSHSPYVPPSISSSQQFLTNINPPMWIVPFDQRANLIGRVAEKAQIENALFSSTTCSKVAIEGLGGVGKSRLALEIAYSTRSSQPDRSIFWIQCSDRSSFERDCRKMAQALELPGAEDLSKDPKTLMKQHLDKDETADWLLILDSADDEGLWSARAAASPDKDTLLNYIPRGRQGAVLITTRTHKIAFDTSQKKIVKLAQLAPNESYSMLTDLLQEHETELNTDAASQLLDHLTHLPLAIVQAAAYINQNNVNIPEYLQIWKDNSEVELIEVLSEDFTDDSRYQDTQNPVAKTWLISFKNIEAQHPLAATVLSYMSCLDHKDMMRSSIPNLNASRLDQQKAFGTLQGYAFIQAQQRNTSDTVYDMHRLVHLATRNYLQNIEEFSKHLRIVAEHLYGLVSEPGIDSTSYWQRYLPHIEKVVSTPDIEQEACYFRLQQLLAFAHYANGAYAKALTYRRVLVERLSAQGEPNELQLMHNLVALADILRLLGRGQESVTAAEEALRLSKRVVPEGNYENVVVMECLARAYGYFRNGQDALRLSLETVALAKSCEYPSQNIRRARIVSALQTLAYTYKILQRHGEEANILLETTEWARKLKLENESLVEKAQIDIALAKAYTRIDKADLAVRILRQLQPELEAKLGKFHGLVLNSISCLAEAYQVQGVYNEAEALYRHLLEMYNKVGRLDDIEVMHDRYQLSCAIFEQGRFSDAKDVQLVNIGIATRATGRDSVITLDKLESLAWCYWYLRKPNVAIGMMKSCHQRSARTLGLTHSDTVNRLAQAQAWQASARSTKPKKSRGRGHVLTYR